jgi:hypothetical protein
VTKKDHQVILEGKKTKIFARVPRNKILLLGTEIEAMTFVIVTS